MGRSSRTSPPPPLELGNPFYHPEETQTPRGRGRDRGSIDSPNFYQSKRVGSYSTSCTSPSVTSRRTSSFGFLKSSPTVNVHTTCGRHTDQLLFGGPSLRGLASAFLGKKKKSSDS